MIIIAHSRKDHPLMGTLAGFIPCANGEPNKVFNLSLKSTKSIEMTVNIIMAILVCILAIFWLIAMNGRRKQLKELSDFYEELSNNYQNRVKFIDRRLEKLENPPKYFVGEEVKFENGVSPYWGTIIECYPSKEFKPYYNNGDSLYNSNPDYVIYHNTYDIFCPSNNRVYKDIREHQINKKH